MLAFWQNLQHLNENVCITLKLVRRTYKDQLQRGKNAKIGIIKVSMNQRLTEAKKMQDNRLIKNRPPFLSSDVLGAFISNQYQNEVVMKNTIRF